MKKCPIGDCGRYVPEGRDMCAPHWRRLPRSIKRVKNEAARVQEALGFFKGAK